MSKNLELFIKALNAFIDMAVRLCPEEEKEKAAVEHIKYKALAQLSPETVWQKFAQDAYPMREQILNKDEQFFLSNQEDLNNRLANEVGGDNAMSLIMNIKKVWLTVLTDDEKEKIWNHLKLIFTLSDRIFAAKLNNN